MQMQPKLALLTDMDGTLLNPDKTLSLRNTSAIADFRAKGGLFSLATGRGMEATLPYMQQLKPDFPVVMYNGALVYDWHRRQNVRTVTLPQEAKAAIAEIIGISKEIGAEMLNSEGVFIVQDSEYEQKHLQIAKVEAHYASLADMDATGCFKALFAAAPEVIDHLVEYVAQPRFADLDFTRSHSWFLELLPKDVSKGTALPTLRDLLPEGTIIGAAGDFDNDLTMLAAADLCACPADAQPVVKEAVRRLGGYVSPYGCGEDFFADWISYFLKVYACGGAVPTPLPKEQCRLSGV